MSNKNSNTRKAILWSIIGTIALLPIASALFLFLFDRGAPIDLGIALTFPYLMYHYQGFLVGTIVNSILLAVTFVPLFLLLRSTWYRNPSNFQEDPREMEAAPSRAYSMPARILSVTDLLLGITVAISAIDYPWISLAVIVPSFAVAYGLFTTQRWGWYLAMGVHALIILGGVVAYGFGAVMAIRDMDRPRGHMEMITSEGVLVIITVAVVAFVLIAALPIIVLRSKRVRSKFFTFDESASE